MLILRFSITTDVTIAKLTQYMSDKLYDFFNQRDLICSIISFDYSHDV